jgi:hypothetical protein
MLLAEQLKPGRFCIIDFSVDSFSGSHTGFRRDLQAHQNGLDEFFRRTGRDFQRFNYLGEWHSHSSFSVHPSTQDINTMTEIVENQSSRITFAVLLIVRLRLRICDRAADGSALSLWSIYVEMRQQIADRRVDFRKTVKNAMPQPPEKPAFDHENRLFGLPPLR